MTFQQTNHEQGSATDSSAFSRSVVALGVVTYNTPQEMLERLAQSIAIAAQVLTGRLGFDVKLVAIDNGKPSSWELPGWDFQRLPSQGNVGFARGMNLLMQAAYAESSCRAFVCVNPDGCLHRLALLELVRTHIAHPTALIEARQFPEEHPKPYDPRTLETEWASGACLLIPRRIFETLGGFDENLFMYVEDVDLSWRVRAQGGQVLVAPRALFAHSVMYRGSNQSEERNMLLSGRYFAKKWGHDELSTWYETELCGRGFGPHSDLPSLPPIVSPTITDPAFTPNFAHGMAFAPLRWHPRFVPATQTAG